MITVVYIIILFFIFLFLGRYLSWLFSNKKSASYKSDGVERNHRELAEAELESRVAKEDEKASADKNKPILDVPIEKSDEILNKEKIPVATKASALLDAPRNGQKDNLSRIKGIGPKIEEQLNSIGYYHFDQVAAWDAEDIEELSKKLAFPGRIHRDDWIGQAKHLAHGEDTEFSKRVDSGQVSSSKKH